MLSLHTKWKLVNCLPFSFYHFAFFCPQIETIGKKVIATRIPYTPAAVCPRITASEPPTKKAKVWKLASPPHMMQHIPLSTSLLLVKHYIQVQPPLVSTRLMIKKSRQAWLTAALQPVWEEDVEPSDKDWVNVIYECVQVFNFIRLIYEPNITDALSVSNEMSLLSYYIIKYCCWTAK